MVYVLLLPSGACWREARAWRGCPCGKRVEVVVVIAVVRKRESVSQLLWVLDVKP